MGDTLRSDYTIGLAFINLVGDKDVNQEISEDNMTSNSLSPSSGFPTDYVMSLERRITQLEIQVQQLEKLVTEQQTMITALNNKLPKTSLLSPRFIPRALSVYGHGIAAQLIIVIPLYLLLVLIISLVGSLGNF